MFVFLIIILTTIHTHSFSLVRLDTSKQNISLKKTSLDVETNSKNEIFTNEKDAALESLQTLVETQRRELTQTEELLEMMQSNSIHQNDDDDIEVPTDNEWIGNANRVASSFLSCADYGYSSRSEGTKFDDHGPPLNAFRMAIQGFQLNMNGMRGIYDNEKGKGELTKDQIVLQDKLKSLQLNVTGIWEKEEAMLEVEEPAPILIQVPYYALCYLLDALFEGRNVAARFYFLETVARVPYFSYISMIHLYETLGWWRRSADAKRIHFAEEWNEFHHLLIMESLGGDQEWWVRSLAMHSAVFYYIALVVLWLISPTGAYKFSELLETHAVNTYGQLLEDNVELLKSMPPPFTAVKYYSLKSQDPLFDEFQTSAMSNGLEARRPGNEMKSLYDVFSAIRDDEGDHVSTMQGFLDPSVVMKSPSIEKALASGLAAVSASVYFMDSTAVISATLDRGMLNGLFGIMESSEVAEQVGDIAEQGIGFVEQAATVADQTPELLEQLGGFLNEVPAILEQCMTVVSQIGEELMAML